MLSRQRSLLSSKSLRVAQLSLAALSLLLAAAVVGTAAHTLHVYRAQNDANNPWWLPLWPSHFDVEGTRVYIGTSAAVLVLSVVYVILNVVPKLALSSQPQLAALIALSVSVLSIVLAVSAITLNHLLENNLADNGRDSIRSWTCKFKSAATEGFGAKVGGTSANISNTGFAAVCTETLFDFWAMVAVLALQTALLVSAGVQWWRAGSGIETTTKDSASDLNISS